jgi:DNA-binding beta-propeller fold protein YncE
MPEQNKYYESLLNATRITLLLLLAAVLIHKAEAELSVSATESPHILVLDNCDSDYKVPPFTDSVLFLNSEGKAINQISGLNICQNIGSNRAISVSQDGQFFVVCENVADKISAYNISTGNLLWSLQGKYMSAVIAQDIVYSLVSDDTTHAERIHAVDHRGNIIKQSAWINGFDMAIEPNGISLWVVGENITKYNKDLQVVQTIDPIDWRAVSVDINSDGSIWVAEREYGDGDYYGSHNRLIGISSQGIITHVIPLKNMTPLCVRVDKSNGNVWTTGMCFRRSTKLPSERAWEYLNSRTRKYSQQGKLLLELKHGGKSIDIDASDGSVWITDKDTPNLYHYSSKGKELNTSEKLSHDHKWITILPK